MDLFSQQYLFLQIAAMHVSKHVEDIALKNKLQKLL
jgi:hypothetical protein